MATISIQKNKFIICFYSVTFTILTSIVGMGILGIGTYRREGDQNIEVHNGRRKMTIGNKSNKHE